MTETLSARSPSAYGYPLPIKQLFAAPLVLPGVLLRRAAKFL